MAEYVNLRTEDLIPEIEKLEQLDIFSKQELKSIARKRKEFEYKIQRRSKCKDDYLRYIQYEVDILRTIKSRREKSGTGVKKADFEYRMAHRVHKLFRQAVDRFKDDQRMWLSYFKFCKQLCFFAHVTVGLAEMLQIHGEKPALWIYAASWEYRENNSVQNARQYLLRGLRIHPKSRELYSESFQLELSHASDMRKDQPERMDVDEIRIEGESVNNSKETPNSGKKSRAEDVQESVKEGVLAELIFENATKSIQDVKFVVGLLQIAKKFDFTTKLQSKIINHLIANYEKDELTWDTLARLELDGDAYIRPPFLQQLYSTISATAQPNNASEKGGSSIITLTNNNDDDDDEDGANKNNKKNNKAASFMKTRIRMCSEVYKMGTERVSTVKMWSLYLEMLLEINQDQSHLPKFKKNLLRESFQGAHSADCMQEKYYLIWLELLRSMGSLKKLESILKSASERNPSSVDLWHVRLQYYIARDDKENVKKVFNRAKANLINDNQGTLQLWKTMIFYYQTKDMQEVENMFQAGVIQRSAISLTLKPMYIEWLVLRKGIAAARKVYEKLSIQPPLCLDLHLKMALLEKVQPNIKVKFLRRCHKMACDQFGNSNADVWIEFIKFELKLGDAKKVSEIYTNAVKTLDTGLSDSFVNEFSLLKTSMSIPNV